MKNIIDPNEIDKLYNDNHISLNEAEELRSKRWITFFWNSRNIRYFSCTYICNCHIQLLITKP